MIVIYAIDALEHNLVEEFDCKNLKQKVYGKTDISQFSQPRTMVLWSSFMTGQNKESEIVGKDGVKVDWNFSVPIDNTFFSQFKKFKVIDLPGFSYDQEVHRQSRKLLKDFFDAKGQDEKEKIRKEYNNDAFSHHRKVKKEFFKAIASDFDLVLGYFSLADVVGHLNFGNKTMMKLIYKELDDIVQKIYSHLSSKDVVLILSDHGMKGVGQFGDHSDHGFWSLNFDYNLERPKLPDFCNIIKEFSQDKS